MNTGNLQIGSARVFSLVAAPAFFLLICVFLVSPNAQDSPTPTPAATPTLSPSPSPSPSASPTPSPTPTPIPGSLNFHQWGSVTLFNGLPSDNVRGVAQTADGVMWFGTDNGLARFDGRRVQTMSLSDEAPEKILALEIAADGSLWIGADAGLFRYKNGAFQTIEDARHLPINAIFMEGNTIFAGSSGAILRLTENAGSSFRVQRIPPDILAAADGQPLKITSFAKIGETVIAGTRSRSILAVGDAGPLEIISRPRPVFVNALAQDEKGRAWLGSDARGFGSGLYSFNDISVLRPMISAKTGSVTALKPDAQGGIWAGTERAGLFHFRGAAEIAHFTFENTAGGLRSNTIYSLMIDREGVLWIGTNRGACRFDSSSPFIQTISENANSNFVRTLYRTAQGRIFAGTNRGLFVFDGKKWSGSSGVSQKAIFAIGESSSGDLLIGTAGGMFDPGGKQTSTGDVRAFANFQGRTYAAVFGVGVMVAGDKEKTTVFANDSTTTLFAGPEKLWIGTAKDGVYTFDGREAKREIMPENLGGATVSKIGAGRGNDVWIGAERGLFLYRDAVVQRVIADPDVRDLVITGEEVWAATLSGGLLHARHDDLFGWIVSDINVEQGLPSQKIFSLLALENKLLIGTNRGVVHYIPTTVAPKLVPVRVVSRRLHEMDELSRTIALEHPQNSLLVEVAGQSSRTFPEQFQYGFILKNSGGDIAEKHLSADAQFSPVNLSPGEYSIEARTFNKDLLASEPLVIKFSIGKAPFPWTATALGVLLFISVIALVWAMVERRRIAERNRELAAARFDLANEAERERRRIARDLHDQTLADLRKMMIASDELPADNTAFRTEIEAVSTEIRRICEDLSPSALENVGLVAALEFLPSRTVENHRFTAKEDVEDQISFPLNVQLQIYRIAQEVLTNINRHSNADLVELSVEVFENEQFRLTIRDNGEPFVPNRSISKGRGISNITSRANLINAKITWKESRKGGNLFLLSIACVSAQQRTNI